MIINKSIFKVLFSSFLIGKPSFKDDIEGWYTIIVNTQFKSYKELYTALGPVSPSEFEDFFVFEFHNQIGRAEIHAMIDFRKSSIVVTDIT